MFYVYRFFTVAKNYPPKPDLVLREKDNSVTNLTVVEIRFIPDTFSYVRHELVITFLPSVGLALSVGDIEGKVWRGPILIGYLWNIIYPFALNFYSKRIELHVIQLYVAKLHISRYFAKYHQLLGFFLQKEVIR